MLFWSFCLLTFVQCVAGLIVSTLCRDFFEDESYDVSLREAVFRYYGTFTRTFLTMFEILFANWGPACRVLVEDFSDPAQSALRCCSSGLYAFDDHVRDSCVTNSGEWFSIFFLLYRPAALAANPCPCFVAFNCLATSCNAVTKPSPATLQRRPIY